MSGFSKADPVSLENHQRAAYYNLTYWAQYFRFITKLIADRDKLARLEEENSTLVTTNEQLAEWAKVRMIKEFKVEEIVEEPTIISTFHKNLDEMNLQEMLMACGYSKEEIDGVSGFY